MWTRNHPDPVGGCQRWALRFSADPLTYNMASLPLYRSSSIIKNTLCGVQQSSRSNPIHSRNKQNIICLGDEMSPWGPLKLNMSNVLHISRRPWRVAHRTCCTLRYMNSSHQSRWRQMGMFSNGTSPIHLLLILMNNTFIPC